METPQIANYKQFIDGLCEFKGSFAYITNAFREGSWTHPAFLKLQSLNDETKAAVLQLMEEAASAAIHDTLVYLTDNDYRIAIAGDALPDRPFDVALYDDWAARSQGIPWPDED